MHNTFEPCLHSMIGAQQKEGIARTIPSFLITYFCRLGICYGPNLCYYLIFTASKIDLPFWLI